MKRFFVFVLVVCLIVCSLAACDLKFGDGEGQVSENTVETTSKTTSNGEALGSGETKGEFDAATNMYYTLNDDGRSYSACPAELPKVVKELVFPGEYKGLPVTEITGYFHDKSIETIIISEGVQVISCNFDYCTGIKNIYIPASVVYIPRGTFNCRATMGGHGHIKSNVIEKIVVAEGNLCYYVDGNCLIEKSSQKIILGCNSSAIPTDGSIKSIGYAAFANCHLIETVILPKSITEIEPSAFDNCDNLKKMYITSSVAEDNKVVNFDPEPVFGYDPLDMIYVPDAASLEMYSGLLGEEYFNIGSPFDRLIPIETAEELAWNYWEQAKNESDIDVSFSVNVLVGLHGDIYIANLEKHIFNNEEQHWTVSTVDSIVIDAYAGKVIDVYTGNQALDATTPQISTSDAIKLAYEYWNLPADSTEDSFSIPVSISTSFDDSGYHTYLQEELNNNKISTIKKLDLGSSFDQLLDSDVREYACRRWGIEEDGFGQCTISSVSLSVERIGNAYRIEMIWNNSYRSQALIDWIYVNVYTGECSVG